MINGRSGSRRIGLVNRKNAPPVWVAPQVPEPRSVSPIGRHQVLLLTSEEAAAFLRIPLNTLYQLRSKGKAPPAVRIGRHVHYRLADLEAYVEENLDDGGAA